MRHATLIAPAIAALLVGACNDRDDAAVAPAAVDEDVAMAPADDAYPVAGEMNPEQQSNYESFDRDAAMQEYQTNSSAMADGDAQAMGGSAQASGSDSQAMSGGQDNAASGAMQQNGANMSGSVPALRPRSQMDFAFLDRNSDGKLSVGEYAIWAVRANPAKPKPDDNNRPFISTEQVNEAGQTFFYFDTDGDTYLSPSEFDAARASARTP
ncbi:MAG: hypothetical protein GC147_12845 [Porphyrobacter sp.]|nr:hypothetical protein [Porphyrobacter sp.]